MNQPETEPCPDPHPNPDTIENILKRKYFQSLLKPDDKKKN
jgi:hypothetical protein